MDEETKGVQAEQANTEPAETPDSNQKSESQVDSAKPKAKAEESPSAEELAEFRKWQESQKSDAEKHAAAISKAEKAKLAAEQKAADFEAKYTAMLKGVNAEAVEDVIALARVKVSDDVTLDDAISEVIKKYPSFTSKPDITTGTSTPNNKSNSNDDTALRRAMGLPVSQNGGN